MPFGYVVPFDPETVWSFLQGDEEVCIDTAVVTGNIGIWGAWTQLVAATTEDIYWYRVDYHEPNNAGTEGISYQLGIGAAAAEEAVAGGSMGNHDGTEDVGWGGDAGPCYIPAGSRVTMRLRNETANAVTLRVNCRGRTAP